MGVSTTLGGVMTTSRRCAAAAALLLPLAVAACSGGPKASGPTPGTAPAVASTSPSPAGELRTYEAVKAAVDRLDAADKAHDGGTDWDMLTAAGQATMSRDDYIRVVKGCPKLAESEPTLSIALNAGGTSATITAAVSPSQGGGTTTWQMVYENGHWRHQPSDAAMSWMGLGADKALTFLRANGAC